MSEKPTTPDGDLFYEGLIADYVDRTPRFVERNWLRQRVQEALNQPKCLIVLLTAELGRRQIRVHGLGS
jgi:hypothetical protein